MLYWVYNGGEDYAYIYIDSENEVWIGTIHNSFPIYAYSETWAADPDYKTLKDIADTFGILILTKGIH